MGMLAAASPAPAFYWSLKSIPTVIGPKNENSPGNPAQPNANPLPLPPETIVPGVPLGPPGSSVPEPATATAGLIGLGLSSVGSIYQRRKRLRFAAA